MSRCAPLFSRAAWHLPRHAVRRRQHRASRRAAAAFRRAQCHGRDRCGRERARRLAVHADRSDGSASRRRLARPRRCRRRRPQRPQWSARLARNPHEGDGNPPFVLIDRYGGIQRYVEPVQNIDLANTCGSNGGRAPRHRRHAAGEPVGPAAIGRAARCWAHQAQHHSPADDPSRTAAACNWRPRWNRQRR